ncbi:NAD(P)H-hydrate dehydratase [Cognatilysobacter segetis]|uniref:NAD(P)H-hydrate dehydratase n=1 Tax=Cognatilysobacter segetis TaxID=2492394 RepID=UPI00105CDA4B|nr:NAD(P)H-hydrate dehydratase [Lysobacter segetis]
MRDLPPLFDTDSVRRFDAAAIAAVGGSSILMTRAGQAAWQRALDLWPAAMRLVVVCGSGGNGGDGYVLATLAHKSGRRVQVIEFAPSGTRHADAAAARQRFVEAGGAIAAWSGVLPSADLVVDALFGIGLAGAPEGAADALIEAINAQDAPVLAIDVPSGVDATGVPGVAVLATATVECLLPKAALRTGRALECAGQSSCAALDVPASVERPRPAAALASVGHLGASLPPRRRDSHKGDHGRIACIGGDHGSGGAILLCAEAALRSGAGLVRVHTRDEHRVALLARLPEAMSVAEDADPAPAWADVTVIGPGLGQGNWGFSQLHRVVEAKRPCVIDADALNLVARHGIALPDGAVATPHPGEAARLLGIPVADVQRDRFGSAARLAERLRSVVVLKGAGTIVAAPEHTPVVLDAGNPGMATGGMGDVLAGVIAAVRAQGLEPFDAACTGALLHSAAADRAAQAGERGLLPTDLMPFLRTLANPA